MKSYFSLLILFVAITIVAPAQKVKTIVTAATPESAGFSSERLKRIDQAMDDWAKKEWYQGAVALVIRDGKIAYYRAAGYNDLEAKTPLKKDDIFRIASQTKAITSAAIMMLFDEGKLLLTDPVSKYIPSFKNPTVLDKFNAADTTYTTVPARREVTIRDLLTHTSGISYAQIGSREATAIYAKHNITLGLGVTDRTLQDAMTELGTLPLMHQPGERWSYGLNTDLLGALVEIISGMSLDEFFRKKIFEPLGVKDTYFQVPLAKASRLVQLYRENAGKLEKAKGGVLGSDAEADYPLKKSIYYSGGAGLSSTVYDYGVFLQMLLNGGEYNGKRILSASSVRLMTMNQIGDLSFGANGDKFSLAFAIVGEKNGTVPAQPGTFSWGGAFATSYWVDPKEKMVMLLYRQLDGGHSHGEVVEKFRALTYAALN